MRPKYVFFSNDFQISVWNFTSVFLCFPHLKEEKKKKFDNLSFPWGYFIAHIIEIFKHSSSWKRLHICFLLFSQYVRLANFLFKSCNLFSDTAYAFTNLWY